MEFTGLHQHTTLISIGIVSDCGKSFYAELNDYDQSQVDDWLKENVIAKLRFSPPEQGEDEYFVATRDIRNPAPNDLYKGYSVELRCDQIGLRAELSRWLRQFRQVEMWSDCLSYDWVLFCQIFGGAFGVPENVYYIPFDICTLFKASNIDPDINRESFACIHTNDPKHTKHNALWDAQIIKKCFDQLGFKIDKL